MGMAHCLLLHCPLQNPSLDRRGDVLVQEALVGSLKNRCNLPESPVLNEGVGNWNPLQGMLALPKRLLKPATHTSPRSVRSYGSLALRTFHPSIDLLLEMASSNSQSDSHDMS